MPAWAAPRRWGREPPQRCRDLAREWPRLLWPARLRGWLDDVKDEPGDRLMIRKKERQVRLLHPVNHDYFKLLRAKLRWGLSPEASPFI